MTHFFNRLIIALFLAGSIVVAAPAAAQTAATQLSSLAVELWPDYDRPSMLVLLTATLPAETALPASLTIPIPADADIHAVASFNEAGALMSDVDYTVENGQLSLTTPANRFRVEYYSPYEADGNDYSYNFEWTSDLAIDQVTVVVQQPVAAVDFRLNPAAASSAAERGDGLTYHTLPPRPLGAGEPLTVEVGYTVEAPVLSAPSQTITAQPTAATTAPAAASEFDPLWLLIGAGVLAVAGGAWYLGHQQGRSAGRARKPQPTRPARTNPTGGDRPATSSGTGAPARFCHSCGHRAQPGDTFCRNCGTQLKGD